MKISTWLPIFPGFYGTLFEDLLQDYDKHGEAIALEDALEEERRDEVAQHAVQFVDKVLRNLEFPGYIGLRFQTLHSPRAYNYSNDEIHVELEVQEDVFLPRLNQIIQQLSESFAYRLKEDFTSRPGFWSRHSNQLDDWFPASIEDEFRSGYYLQFLLDTLAADEDDQAMYEYISGKV